MDTVRRGMKELPVFLDVNIRADVFYQISFQKCDDIAKTRFKSYFEKL